jgi:hypothetical protein
MSRTGIERVLFENLYYTIILSSDQFYETNLIYENF